MYSLQQKKKFFGIRKVTCFDALPDFRSMVLLACSAAIFLLICLCCSPAAYAQSKNDISSRGIKSVAISTFDARKKDTTGRKNVLQYDQRGNVLESIEYDTKGNVKSREQFEYNRHDDETSYRLLDANGKIIKSIYTTYDKWKHVAEKSTMDSLGATVEKTVNAYNPLNDLTDESTFDKDGRMTHHVLYSYDNKGMLLNRKVYNEKGELIYSKEYTYQY